MTFKSKLRTKIQRFKNRENVSDIPPNEEYDLKPT
jgi:hypothetical protein